ncbi:MAG: phytochelatin synthase family protein [Deltaproteobacteria bacterium]
MSGTALRIVALLALGMSACASNVAHDTATSAPLADQPKYAAHATPLTRDHDYFTRAPAVDFWALAPYYVGQQDDVSCSLASLTMLVNAARRGSAPRSEEPLVSQPRLLERVASDVWTHGLAPGGPGVTLEELAVLARQSLEVYGMKPQRVEVTHVAEVTPAALERLRDVLRANESSGSDWLLFNFLARTYLGTGEAGDYGHIAPVGAYDAERQRVLVLDPDRQWYEPYWLADDVALAGMATRDPDSGQPRGYVYVSLPVPAH